MTDMPHLFVKEVLGLQGRVDKGGIILEPPQTYINGMLLNTMQVNAKETFTKNIGLCMQCYQKLQGSIRLEFCI